MRGNPKPMIQLFSHRLRLKAIDDPHIMRLITAAPFAFIYYDMVDKLGERFVVRAFKRKEFPEHGDDTILFKQTALLGR